MTLSNITSQKKVMVFGVFDRLHPGHISFLKQAAQLGDELIVAVARDSIVQCLKKKIPTESEEIRIKRVSHAQGVTHAMLGDEKLGSWDLIRVHKPDIICLGYDQHWIKKDIEERITKGLLSKVNLIVARAYGPDTFHSSLMVCA